MLFSSLAPHPRNPYRWTCRVDKRQKRHPPVEQLWWKSPGPGTIAELPIESQDFWTRELIFLFHCPVCIGAILDMAELSRTEDNTVMDSPGTGEDMSTALATVGSGAWPRKMSSPPRTYPCPYFVRHPWNKFKCRNRWGEIHRLKYVQPQCHGVPAY